MSTETNVIGIKLLDDGLPLPESAYEGDCAVDLCTTEDLSIGPQQRCTVPTGIAIALPRGFAGLVLPRSGLASKHGITIVNAPGLIDSDYRGEILVVLLNTDNEETFRAKRGDRIAQLMVVQLPKIAYELQDELSKTDRGDKGFGSSGFGVTITDES